MLQSLPGKDCYTCYDLEQGKKRFDIISDRVFYLRELKRVPRDIYQAGNHDLHTIDVRWSNLCNFACVYCNEDFSSRWASELKIHREMPSQQQIEQFKNYIFDRAEKLKLVYLAGGEPLLMKENLELLSLLLEVNPDVHLRINTNLSKVDTKVYDLINQFQNVHWTVSVETMHEEFDYVRWGGSWPNFVENLASIRTNSDHKISFNMLHFLLNYDSIFDCIDFLLDDGFHPNSFIAGGMLSPVWLNVRHLPDSILDAVRNKLKTRIDQHPGYLLEDSYRNMLTYLDQPMQKNFKDSLRRLAELDSRRNLDSRRVFPDLYQIEV
jgi:MoaA/NifB/PqqE/SkfB family radical SAM enzyme